MFGKLSCEQTDLSRKYAMDALEALHNRDSAPRLGGEIPHRSVLSKIFKAALRVPDHGQLKPWRFLEISGPGLEKLGDLFVRAQLEDQPEMTQAAIDKARMKPGRAPMIIVVIATIQPHPKVPEIEQMLSAGAAAQNMLLAAHALEVGAIWRTGSMAYHPTVLSGIGLAENERLIGYLYLGEIDGKTRVPPELNTDEYFESWP